MPAATTQSSTIGTPERENRSRLYFAVVAAFYFLVLVSLPLVLMAAGCASGG